jgi:hypothetical protein
MKIQAGDIVERDGVKYRVGDGGELIRIEYPLAKRFAYDDCEMTSGVRRAMENNAPQS